MISVVSYFSRPAWDIIFLYPYVISIMILKTNGVRPLLILDSKIQRTCGLLHLFVCLILWCTPSQPVPDVLPFFLSALYIVPKVSPFVVLLVDSVPTEVLLPVEFTGRR